MKKIYIPISAIISLSIVLFPASVFAIFSRTAIISGPSGPSNNGWYTSVATVTIQTEPICDTGPGVGLPLYSNAAPQNIEGIHNIKIFSSNSGTPHDIIYDTVNGKTYTNELWRCAVLDQPDHEIIEEYIFNQDIRYDFNNPTISISSPGNNTNTDNAALLISGNVSDSGSGVRSVVIKGVNASISGSTFSANVPVSNGLNTLTAVVTDNAGRTAQAQVVVNRINSCGGTCSASGGSSKPSTASNGTTTSQQPATNTPQTTNKAENVAEGNNETPTLVKGVIQGGGIGLVTVLAFIVLLLVLDRLRIIEIKAFSKITDKLSKAKTKKD